MLRVKFERLRLGWSQTVLAFRTGMSAAEISRIETGRTNPYPSQMNRLCRALGLSAGSLLENIVEDSSDEGGVPVTDIGRQGTDAPARDDKRRVHARQFPSRCSCTGRSAITSPVDGPPEKKPAQAQTRGERSHA